MMAKVKYAVFHKRAFGSGYGLDSIHLTKRAAIKQKNKYMANMPNRAPFVIRKMKR